MRFIPDFEGGQRDVKRPTACRPSARAAVDTQRFWLRKRRFGRFQSALDERCFLGGDIFGLDGAVVQHSRP